MRVVRIGVWFLAAFLMACGRSEKNTVHRDPNAIQLDLVAEPEGCKFLAAVEFERIGLAPSEAVRSERALAGDIPVELKPIKVISGSWTSDKPVRVEGSLYLASSADTRWLAVLVKDPQGKPRWFSEFALRDGKIYEGGTDELIGEEKDASSLLLTYLKKTPITGL